MRSLKTLKVQALRKRINLMEEFPYYGLSWFAYLVVAAIFILLSAWKTKSWNLYTRIPVISFISAMALTPSLTVVGDSWWSPAAIIMIFEIDQQGMVGAWRGAIPILISWILLMTLASVYFWKLKPKKHQDRHHD